MEVIRCPKGHFYDADKNTTCPACAKESGNQEFSYGHQGPGKTAPATYSSTEPVTDGGYTPPVGAAGNMINTQAFVEDGKLNVDPIIKTEPIDPVPGTVPPSVSKSGAGKGKDVEGYDPTMAIGPNSNIHTQSETGTTPHYSGDPFINHIQSFNPVTGWLVCIKGSNKGTDYRIRSQYNYIGRAKHMDICISGDEYISAEKAAILAYDDVERKFFIAPGMGHNLIRLNDKMVMGSELLHPYDKITIGKTVLLFVPLCGEEFDWAES